MTVRFYWRSLLLALVVCLGLVAGVAAAETVPIDLGHSSAPLNGPWAFALGDDPRRADPGFDDSAWERVDLKAAPGAHDGDVGLKRYVPGWNGRGHLGTSGYAWYRVKVAVTGTPGDELALAGPTAVDSAYQLYADGRLLGGSGDFSGAAPIAYSVQPRVFRLGVLPADGSRTVSLALRVWMSPSGAKVPDAGGLHVAPVLGDREGVDAVVQGQWLQSFEGYVADALEPALFVVLALMLIPLVGAAPRGAAPLWLAGALVVLALLRLQQVLLFWTQWESQHVFDIMKSVLLGPLALGAWTLAWRNWFAGRPSRAFSAATAGLVALYVAVQLFSRSWWPPAHALGLSAEAAQTGATWIRLALLALYLWTVGSGAWRARDATAALAVVAAIAAGIGLFAGELSMLRVKSIWFPWGVGVARGQFAYAGLIVVLFTLILTEFRRLAGSARTGGAASARGT